MEQPFTNSHGLVKGLFLWRMCEVVLASQVEETPCYVQVTDSLLEQLFLSHASHLLLYAYDNR